MQKLIVTFFLALPLTLFASNGIDKKSGNAAFDRGDYASAFAELSQYPENQSGSVAATILLGRTHLELFDLESAANQFKRAINLDPKNAVAHYWYGVANGQLAGNASLFQAGGYAKKSRQAFATALDLDPGNIDAHRGMIEYYTHAPRLYGGDTATAISAAHRLKLIDDLEGRLALAEVYQRKGQRDEAVVEYEEIANAYPNDPRSFFMLGLLSNGDGQHAEARELFIQAVAGKVSNQETENAMKGALYQLGRTAVISENWIDEGIAAFEKYLLLPINSDLPEKAWAHYRLASLYELQGKQDQAKTHYAAARLTEDDDLQRLLDSK